MGYTETDPRNPGLGTGGAPTGGPRYKFDAEPRTPTRSSRPSTTGSGSSASGTTAGSRPPRSTPTSTAVTNVATTPWRTRSTAPHEMEFGPDGSLYVIDWGTGFNGNNIDSGIFRIDYVKGARRADRPRRGRHGRRPDRR